MRHLPTAGGGPALTAVLGNHAALLAAHPAVGGPQARAGTLRPIGTMGAKRVAAFPDVPTLKELGYDAQYYQWNGVFTQAKVPEPIINIWRAGGGQGGEGSGIHQGHGQGRQRHRLSRPRRIPAVVGRGQQEDRGSRARHRQGAVAAMAAKEIGLAIVGSGRIGTLRAKLAAGHPAVRFIAVSDADPAKARKLARDRRRARSTPATTTR